MTKIPKPKSIIFEKTLTKNKYFKPYAALFNNYFIIR